MSIDTHKLYKIILDRITTSPGSSYTANLSSRGLDRVAQKLGEEATELIIEAVKGSKNKKRIIEESADLLFHYWVLLANCSVTPDEVFKELEDRHKSNISNISK